MDVMQRPGLTVALNYPYRKAAASSKKVSKKEYGK